MFAARHRLGRDTMRILLDRSTRAIARVFEQGSKRLEASSHYASHTLAGIVARRTGRDREAFVAEQRGAILALARLAKAGKANLYTTRIGFDEGIRVATWPDPAQELDIFSNSGVTNFEWVQLPFDFAKILGFYGNDLGDAERYKQTLRTVTDPQFVKGVLKNPSAFGFSDAEVKNLSAIAPVLRAAGPNSEHLLDVFQLWTAEVNGIPYFVTCDKTFIRFMTDTMKNPFASKPILPSKLCSEQSVAFNALGPTHENDFYTWAEAPLTQLIKAHDRGEAPPRAFQSQDT